MVNQLTVNINKAQCILVRGNARLSGIDTTNIFVEGKQLSTFTESMFILGISF